MVKKIISILFLFILCNSLFAQNISLLPTSNGQIIKHEYYTLSFLDDYKQSEWTFYLSTKANLINRVERDNQFRKDPLLKSKSANNGDYLKSGYDKGHLIPANDLCFSLQSMTESFYFTNISPQVPNFNRGVWESLEEQVRGWVNQKDSLYIITGPVFLNVQGYIGQNKIAVPGYFYKIIYSPKDKSMIGFVLPNKKNISKNLSNYVYNIDFIEVMTRIDFFNNLPDDIEKNMEDKVNMNYWKF
jgi:endonuclease G, mitochondrial